MPAFWYAVASHPHKEDLLWKQLLSKDIEVFFPRLRVQPVNPRSRKVRPYFPGYMFVKVDLELSGISVIRYMPHAKGIVSFGDEPAIVPEGLIEKFRQRIGEIAEAGGEALYGLKQGDPIVIEAGPFSGYEAIFDTRIAGTERVRVLLRMLNDRQLQVELKAANIKKQRP